MFTPNKSSDFVRRTLTVAIASMAMCSTGALQAQTSVAAPAVDFKTYTAPSFAMVADDQSSASSSSSSSSNEQAAVTTVDPLHLNAMQYERRRYGRPRYRGGNTNPDGSNKWTFYGGGGFAQPLGNTDKYFTPSWGVQIGGGRQFSNHFAVPIEFDYDNFGMTKQSISNQAYIYTGDPNAADNGIDSNGHSWSFSVDPTYTLLKGSSGDGFGMYVVGVVGFFHKVTNFTVAEAGCDPYYAEFYGICIQETVNQIFDHYTSNAPGFGGGIGFTYKVSHFSGVRLYAEARYVFEDNSQRQGLTASALASQLASNPNYVFPGNNVFPANSNKTTYIPIKFGVRF